MIYVPRNGITKLLEVNFTNWGPIIADIKPPAIT